jgi:hypothetical protein
MNRLASAPLASASRGSSFEMIMNLACSWPVHADKYFRSIVIASSPVIDSSRSAIACWSARPPSRASEIMATRFPISGARPKFVPSPVRVGATALSVPTSRVSTRAMVPLPERFGPMTRKAFCWLVSLVRQYRTPLARYRPPHGHGAKADRGTRAIASARALLAQRRSRARYR